MQKFEQNQNLLEKNGLGKITPSGGHFSETVCHTIDVVHIFLHVIGPLQHHGWVQLCMILGGEQNGLNSLISHITENSVGN